ncbi:hypothetical protein BE22_0031 [Staphylococcus phage vB_SepS_BE22]|nr:hypothetical protein BE22_0031 [Staphylococcus phage vB_SepS_BE22]WNM53820.1 hypothetical protein CoNPh14_CDS0140 [Staphylococcus phage S-CoN_Ph14]WNM53875.1 hypothetical protein CoNPh15_CDS0028 [Staphylococcus phage S-CoN_Ph15]WNM54167.1 hypothetical protein CoNPh16_CDS0153 [Staphylococcus phage S-CoN_Ph16]
MIHIKDTYSNLINSILRLFKMIMCLVYFI